MKLKVKIDGQFYEVEIGNLSDRPILAVVDGETFEVWPEGQMPHTAALPLQIQRMEIAPLSRRESGTPAAVGEKGEVQPSQGITSSKASVLKVVKAPIPGVITAVMIQPGSEVEVGQELCKLEAMKMNNSIRSSRSGRINTVKVSIGQHVKHDDILFEFAE